MEDEEASTLADFARFSGLFGFTQLRNPQKSIQTCNPISY